MCHAPNLFFLVWNVVHGDRTRWPCAFHLCDVVSSDTCQCDFEIQQLQVVAPQLCSYVKRSLMGRRDCIARARSVPCSPRESSMVSKLEHCIPSTRVHHVAHLIPLSVSISHCKYINKSRHVINRTHSGPPLILSHELISFSCSTISFTLLYIFDSR